MQKPQLIYLSRLLLFVSLTSEHVVPLEPFPSFLAFSLWAVWFLVFYLPQVSSLLKAPFLVFQHNYGFLFCHSKGLEEEEAAACIFFFDIFIGAQHVLICRLKPETLRCFPSSEILSRLFNLFSFSSTLKKISIISKRLF